jgi:cyclopropane fatty-acyl-phospholipid synthase-like methyltransferase
MEKWANFFQSYRDIPIKDDNDLLYQVALTVGGKPISNKIFNCIIVDIENNLKLNHSDYLLDLCCGNGVITYEIGRKVYRIIGLDSSKLYIENAKAYKITSSIEYIEMDIINIDKISRIGAQKFNKVLFYGSIAYFTKQELKIILGKLYNLTSDDVIVLIGSILDYSKRFKFYNTVSRKWHYLLYVIFNRDLGLGTWWRQSEILEISQENGFKCTFLQQNPSLSTAHYRFDCILTKE